MKRTQLAICTGKHCRKVGLSKQSLARELDEIPIDVRNVRCQKICRPPVVGLRIDGEWQWFSRMDSRKAFASLRELIEIGHFPKALKDRRSRKRAGKLRR